MEIYERVEAVQHKVQDLIVQIEWNMRELDEIKKVMKDLYEQLDPTIEYDDIDSHPDYDPKKTDSIRL